MTLTNLIPMRGLRTALALALLTLAACQPATTADGAEMKFKRIPLQFIAALGEPDATSGTGAQNWGVWPVDPGPRGVGLRRFDKLQAAGNIAPAGWPFDPKDWWLEENGLIMESPEFPMQPGQYVVTGDRAVTTVLTLYPPDASGDMRWELADGATLYDVTHLGCRSARYTPLPGALEAGKACTPASAPEDAFRVAPGAAMPAVDGCAKQDYAVLFLTAVAES